MQLKLSAEKCFFMQKSMHLIKKAIVMANILPLFTIFKVLILGLFVKRCFHDLYLCEI